MVAPPPENISVKEIFSVFLLTSNPFGCIIDSQAPHLNSLERRNTMSEYKIGAKLEELRIAKGLTQGELAKILAVSNKTISKWENNASSPDLATVIKLSKFFGVTIDTLLGLSQEPQTNIQDALRAIFRGMNRESTVLTDFEIARTISNVIVETFAFPPNALTTGKVVYPTSPAEQYRSIIAVNDLFHFSIASKSVNAAVMLLGNEENFAWMNDPEKQKKIVQVFRFLSHEDALSALYFIHSQSCSESFTAEYIATNTGIEETRVGKILDELCDIGACHKTTAHLLTGPQVLYKTIGDGLLLALISLAYDKMCGFDTFAYCTRKNSKMIGDLRNESVE